VTFCGLTTWKLQKQTVKYSAKPFLEPLPHIPLGITSRKQWKQPNSGSRAEATLRHPFCCCKLLAHLPRSLRFFFTWVKGKVFFRLSNRHNSQHVCVVGDQPSASGPTSCSTLPSAPSVPSSEPCRLSLAGEAIRVQSLC